VAGRGLFCGFCGLEIAVRLSHFLNFFPSLTVSSPFTQGCGRGTLGNDLATRSRVPCGGGELGVVLGSLLRRTVGLAGFRGLAAGTMGLVRSCWSPFFRRVKPSGQLARLLPALKNITESIGAQVPPHADLHKYQTGVAASPALFYDAKGGGVDAKTRWSGNRKIAGRSPTPLALFFAGVK